MTAHGRHIIVCWSEIADQAAIVGDLDRIFFESSNTKHFASETLRAEFRERWLGRYLRLDPDEACIALDGEKRCIGYLVGCLSDPASTPRFDDIGYFHLLADLTRRFPAHLHINIAPEARSRGIGAELIEAFAARAARQGAPGFHVVTGEGLRNVGFYLRNQFTPVRTFPWNGRNLVMLARPCRGTRGN